MKSPSTMLAVAFAGLGAVMILAQQAPAYAAEDCMAQITQVKGVLPSVAASKQKEVKKYLTQAEDELNNEHDEDECLEAIGKAKKVLGVK